MAGAGDKDRETDLVDVDVDAKIVSTTNWLTDRTDETDTDKDFRTLDFVSDCDCDLPAHFCAWSPLLPLPLETPVNLAEHELAELTLTVSLDSLDLG